MKRILPVILALSLLLCGCRKDEPAESTPEIQDPQPSVTETVNTGEGEGILDPTTEIRYLIVKKIVTNEQGQELWGTDYSYDETGFRIAEREYSNIGSPAASRINTPDALGRIGTSVFTEQDGSHYTVTYTYDEQDRCIREDLTYENGAKEYTEYTYNDQGQYLTLKQYIDGQLAMDYSFSYTYDGAGRQMSLDEYIFGDLLHHTAFEYDAEGREIGTITSLVNGEIQSRTKSEWDGLTETRYFYSGQEQEPFMVSVFTYDGNGNVVFEETRQGDTVINRAEYIYEPFEVKK